MKDSKVPEKLTLGDIAISVFFVVATFGSWLVLNLI